MTTIRLTRIGSKKRPHYRLVVTDSRMKRDGRFIEILGHYHPLENPAKIELKEDRILHYIKNGATLSDTVRSLCEKKGLNVKEAASA